jgi:hypothetical protein
MYFGVIDAGEYDVCGVYSWVCIHIGQAEIFAWNDT